MSRIENCPNCSGNGWPLANRTFLGRECEVCEFIRRKVREEQERVMGLAIKHLPWDVADRFTEGEPDSADGKNIADIVMSAITFGLQAALKD